MKLLQDYQTEKRHQRNHKFEITKQLNEIEKSCVNNKNLPKKKKQNMKDSSSSGPRKGRSRNYNNKNRNNNRRHVKQKVPRRAKKKSLVKRILEVFGIGKTKQKKKTAKKNPRNMKTSQN